MEIIATYKKLPVVAQVAIAVTGSAITLFIGYKIYQALNVTDAERAAKLLKTENKSEESENIKAGMKYSYPASQYVAMANQIYDGMKVGLGDNYGGVRDTLMLMKNDLDVNAIVKAFGQRQAYVFGIASGGPKDLFTMVKSELGDEWGGLTSYKLDAINADWKKKGISYVI